MQNEITELRTQVRTLERNIFGLKSGIMLPHENRIKVLEDKVKELEELVHALKTESTPSVIQAKRFEVVNDEGQVIVELGNLRCGGYVSTRNKEGKYVAGLGAGEDGGYVSTWNKEGKAVAGLGADGDGDGAVETFNKEGEYVAGLSVTANEMVQQQNKSNEGAPNLSCLRWNHVQNAKHWF